jgi:hypothetical protein
MPPPFGRRMITARPLLNGRPHTDRKHLGRPYEREEIAMHSTPDAVLMLHNVRQRELQDEAARIRAARRSNAKGFHLLGVAAASHHLRTALGHAGELLRDGSPRKPGAPLRAEAG